MRRRLLALVGLLLVSACIRADAPGRFDYYVLALSWSPQYCASSTAGSDPQCSRPFGFVVHGLWPQHERGWPQDCGKGEWLPESLIERMLPIMPSRKLVLHEWRKHGVCSGLGAEGYFSAVERAYRAVRIPERYRSPRDYLRVSTTQLEADFRAANPALRPDGIALECSGNYLKEIRLCLDKSLAPRACGSDVRDRCGAQTTLRPSRP